MTENRMDAPSGSAAEPPMVRLCVHRLEIALSVIAHGLPADEDRAERMKEIAQAALDEYRKANIPVLPRLWWCVNCQGHRPGREYHGDLLCVCGHVIATYQAARGEPLGEPSKSSPSQTPEASA